MIFYDLLNKYNWNDLHESLLVLYPDEERNMKGYKSVFETLISIETIETDFEIIIENCIDTNSDGEKIVYESVSGKKLNPENGESEIYGLDFTPWGEWLCMSINENTRNNYSEPEIICHCLNEMTFYGFTQEKIQEQACELQAIIDEFDNMSDEEKAANTYTFDEVKKIFEIDDDIPEDLINKRD
ncbi:MAG: hypothetical protein KIT33_01055 [Candidatus Kapabacteria bacterium]|nr:hypothetical protein [Ignavibacteriota bacterium]MCW5883536.1 hypothetical protein [Candidatus Kapabacteria bacterium]